MPNPNGFDLARRIRKSFWNKSAPIVIVTGRDDRRTCKSHLPLEQHSFSRSARTNKG